MNPVGRGFIAVDCGNTRIKAVWFASESDESPEVRCFSGAETESLIEWVEELKGEGKIEGALSIVGRLDTRLAESLRRVMGEGLLVLTPATELPIKVGYKTPLTLGMDRKATACAAARLYPGERILVIDAGTALTIDRITPEGEFAGGNISPGLRLRFKSLHEFTARLPMIEDIDSPIIEFGDDTASAIRSGVIGGWIDEMASIAIRSSEEREIRILLTGGDSRLAESLLPERIQSLNPKATDKITIEHYPHLLAEGLRAIYRHHENEN